MLALSLSNTLRYSSACECTFGRFTDLGERESERAREKERERERDRGYLYKTSIESSGSYQFSVLLALGIAIEYGRDDCISGSPALLDMTEVRKIGTLENVNIGLCEQLRRYRFVAQSRCYTVARLTLFHIED